MEASDTFFISSPARSPSFWSIWKAPRRLATTTRRTLATAQAMAARTAAARTWGRKLTIFVRKALMGPVTMVRPRAWNTAMSTKSMISQYTNRATPASMATPAALPPVIFSASLLSSSVRSRTFFVPIETPLATSQPTTRMASALRIGMPYVVPSATSWL